MQSVDQQGRVGAIASGVASHGGTALPWQTQSVNLWTVVIPVKGESRAKSRFGPGDNSALALAMALDTVAAALAATGVDRVIVVTAADRSLFTALGATTVVDPKTGLGAAISAGLSAANSADGTLDPGVAHTASQACSSHANVAVLLGDLPGMHPIELSTALEAAAKYPLSMIADADGTGTTFAAATHGHTHALAFGPESRAAHRDAGYRELIGTWPGLRRDVDLPEHLAGLDAGPRTRGLFANDMGEEKFPPPIRRDESVRRASE